MTLATGDRKTECLAAIRSANEMLIELAELIQGDAQDSDTPLAFLELAHDAQYQINRAVTAALSGVLAPNDEPTNGS